MKLNEGLRSGDLDDLILSEVSVDEFESKIMDDALVVGIKTLDKEPAEDLSRYIERSGIDLLDADVSPGPDEDGNYYVFIEFMRDKTFPKKLDKILSITKKITNISEWKIKAYHLDDAFPYSEEIVRKKIRLKSPQVDEAIINYVANSVTNTVKLQENKLYLDNLQYEIVSFGNDLNLYSAFKFPFKPLRLDETAQRSISIIQSKLGDQWSIKQIDEYLLCQQHDSTKLLILKG